MGMTSYLAFSCVFLVLFVAEQNTCFPVFNSSEEAMALLYIKDIENPTSNEEQLAKKMAAEEGKRFKKIREKARIQIYKDRWDDIVTAVVSRGILETFFTMNVKKYLPREKPDEIYYTPSIATQIRTAYENFLGDTKNKVANAIRELFPGKVQEIPRAMAELHDKLSWFDKLYYESFQLVEKFETLKTFIQSKPARLNEEQIKLVENILLVINRFEPENLDEKYFKYNHPTND